MYQENNLEIWTCFTYFALFIFKKLLFSARTTKPSLKCNQYYSTAARTIEHAKGGTYNFANNQEVPYNFANSRTTLTISRRCRLFTINLNWLVMVMWLDMAKNLLWVHLVDLWVIVVDLWLDLVKSLIQRPYLRKDPLPPYLQKCQSKPQVIITKV